MAFIHAVNNAATLTPAKVAFCVKLYWFTVIFSGIVIAAGAAILASSSSPLIFITGIIMFVPNVYMLRIYRAARKQQQSL